MAGGPSLRPEDVDAFRGHAFVIAINDSYRLAPWAEVLYASDYGWWNSHPEATDFPGKKLACQNQNVLKYGVTVLKNLGYLGWSDDPTGVFTGGHSGYQAVQVAAQYASTIVLLGYDLKASPDGRNNWYDNPKTKPFDRWRATYGTLARAAAVRGLTILNCSRDTVLTEFPRHPVREVLSEISGSIVRA